MKSNTAFDFLTDILLASTTLGGLVVVFLATATNQMKALRDRARHAGEISGDNDSNHYGTRYIATQYLLLEWAALSAFAVFTVAIILDGSIMLQWPQKSDAVTNPWMPRIFLSMLLFGLALMLLTTFGVVYNDHRFNKWKARQHTLELWKRVMLWPFQQIGKSTCAKAVAFLIGTALIAYLTYLARFLGFPVSPRAGMRRWDNPALWMVLAPALSSYIAVLALYALSGYRSLIRELDTLYAYALIKSMSKPQTDGSEPETKLLMCSHPEQANCWSLPFVEIRSKKGNRDYIRRELRKEVSKLIVTDKDGKAPTFSTVDDLIIMIPPEDELMPQRWVFEIMKTDGDKVFKESEFAGGQWVNPEEIVKKGSSVDDDIAGALRLHFEIAGDQGYWRKGE